LNLSSVSLSATTAAPSIIEDIDSILGTDSTSYPLATKLRNINLHYYDVVTDILSTQSNWEWDDTNTTDFPIGTTNLVVAQRDYTLPSNFLKLLRVEVLDSGGNYQKVTQIDEQQISQGLETFMAGGGLPVFYREIGNSIELYPSADATATTLTAGLKIYYQRTQTEFTTSDASTSPGFAAPFHRILSIGAAYDYAFSKTLPIATPLKQRLDELRQSLREYYSTRNREVKPKLQIKYRNYE
jgi:hypothetical protein